MYLTLYMFCLMCLCGCVYAADSSDEDTERQDHPIYSDDEALERALAFTGLELEEERSKVLARAMVIKVPAIDSTFPFVGDGISGQEVWEVTLDRVSWARSCVGTEDRVCRLWFDPSDGRLLLAHIYLSDDTLPPATLPSSTHLEKVTASAGFQCEEIPTTIPKTSLLQAFFVPTLSHPCRATEVIVWYSLVDYGNPEPIPHWFIIGKNVPAMVLHRPDGAPSREPGLRDYLSVINDNTGKPQIFMSVD